MAAIVKAMTLIVIAVWLSSNSGASMTLKDESKDKLSRTQ